LTPADEATAIGGRVSLALPQGKRVSLAILTGPRKGDVVLFDKPRMIVGREGGQAEVQLADPEVSRHHASVECLGSRIVVTDLGSRNGTFVGTERIQTRELEDHAEFRVGGTILMLILADG
jgi:S-DNA-T family DNA segregation ATPase FtsK/SpoIIIE